MAIFPSFESVLLQIAKALGANSNMSSKSKSKFKFTDMSMANMLETWEDILRDIADALGLDEDAKNDLVFNITTDYKMHKAIETRVYSFKATQRKILWQYLARFLIPGVARHSVFWQLESKLDEGMPGGKFWYLPFADESLELVQLPVPQVLDWLIDLIQDSKASIAKNLEEDLRIYDSGGTILKNLYNWKSAKNTPEISSIINTFPDDVKIHYLGCFEPDNKTSQFEQALNFVESKGLSCEILQHEIAISKVDLERILNDEGTAEEQQDFVQKLKLRYQTPSPKTIRTRLLVARAIQLGYEQLVKFLTPSVDKLCSDFNTNKSLQLIRLYNDIYNRTLEAYLKKREFGELAENGYFTASLPPYLRYDLLLYISYDNKHPEQLVSDRLNSIFSRSGEEDNVDNILPTSPKDMRLMANVLREEGEHSKHHFSKLNFLVDKLKQNKAPFKQLQSMGDFEVVYSAFGDLSISSSKIRKQMLQRMKELELTSEQSMQRIIIELQYYLLEQTFDSKTESKVTALLQEAKACSDFDFFKARVLQLEAFHLIAQNKLSEAEKILKLAIEECKKYSFGKLRGDLAKDAFSLAIANQRLIPNNHEKYYRDMLYWGSFDDNVSDLKKIDIYNTSRELHEYFWEERYKCYPNYDRLYSSARADSKAFFLDLAAAVKDNLPIVKVLKKHKALQKKQLKHPQADSVIMSLMKMQYEMQIKFKTYRQVIPLDIMEEFNTVSAGTIRVIREIVEEWKGIADLSDFKHQTPLMLAANSKDYETVEVLLKANANPNLRDFTGRTAFHSAAASRCLRSTKLLLEHGCDGKIVNNGGATALHTAVRVGEIPIVKLIMQQQPELLRVEDGNGYTPEQLARAIAKDYGAYEYLNTHLRAENRTTVSHTVYKQLIELF